MFMSMAPPPPLVMSRTDAQNALYSIFKAWSHSVRYTHWIHDKDSLMYNKQLLDEVYCDMKIINVEVRVISRAEGKDDNSYRDIDNFAYHKNRIIVLLYILSGKNQKLDPIIVLPMQNRCAECTLQHL